MSRTNRTALTPDVLDDRLVPAMVLDLTTADAEGGAAGAIVRQVDAQPTGTGYIQSFVRVQSAASGSAVTEQGYNTTARPLQFDENKSPQFTRSLTLDDVPTTEVGGVAYREFLLDVNQKSSSPKLSLDEVRLYLGTAPDLTGYNATTKQLAGLDAVFDLDSAGDVSVLLDYRLNSGSGSGDMILLVPETAFAGAPASTFLYLYSKFGGESGAGANSGFEEWAVRGSGGYGGGNSGGGTGEGPTEVSTNNSLSGYVYLDAGGNGLREDGELGIANVIIHLSGTDALGQTVSLVTTTDVNGYYEFINLTDGTYTIWEEDMQDALADYLDGAESLGTVGGSMANDLFTEISLFGGMHGLFYNFGELEDFGDGGF